MSERQKPHSLLILAMYTANINYQYLRTKFVLGVPSGNHVREMSYCSFKSLSNKIWIYHSSFKRWNDSFYPHHSFYFIRRTRECRTLFQYSGKRKFLFSKYDFQMWPKHKSKNLSAKVSEIGDEWIRFKIFIYFF